jgi:hypothetical protein
MAQHFKDLIAWQKAMELVVDVYAATEGFSSRERFSLTDQIRRAAVSVPSNIAEGQAHFSKREFRHFLRIIGRSRDADVVGAEIEVSVGCRGRKPVWTG